MTPHASPLKNISISKKFEKKIFGRAVNPILVAGQSPPPAWPTASQSPPPAWPRRRPVPAARPAAASPQPPPEMMLLRRKRPRPSLLARSRPAGRGASAPQQNASAVALLAAYCRRRTQLRARSVDQTERRRRPEVGKKTF
jgi:hypothetical protein